SVVSTRCCTPGSPIPATNEQRRFSISTLAGGGTNSHENQDSITRRHYVHTRYVCASAGRRSSRAATRRRLSGCQHSRRGKCPSKSDDRHFRYGRWFLRAQEQRSRQLQHRHWGGSAFCK